jgi:putative FmdB family regulatory protein
MPIYDYACERHGSFELSRPMSQSSESAACPECGHASARTVTAPRLRTLGSLVRSSMDRNEKSRHAPHVCGSTCHHRAGGKKPVATEKPKLTSYRGPRPWVVEHS